MERENAQNGYLRDATKPTPLPVDPLHLFTRKNTEHARMRRVLKKLIKYLKQNKRQWVLKTFWCLTAPVPKVIKKKATAIQANPLTHSSKNKKKFESCVMFNYLHY